MAKHKAGLHKEVAMIFNSVWTPQTDNIQQHYNTSSHVAALYIHPKSTVLKESSKIIRKSAHSKDSRRISWDFFSPKARREKKRLLSISKNLLINFPS
jgi:hypothetical protein